MCAARETCTWTIVRLVEKSLRTAQVIGIHLLSEKAICSGASGVRALQVFARRA